MGREVNDNVGNQSPEGGSNSAQLLEQSTDNNAYQKAVADSNRGTDMNRLGFPDGGRLIEAQYRPEQQRQGFDPGPLEPRSGVYKAASPAGLDGDVGEEWQGRPPGSETNWRRSHGAPTTDAQGNTHHRYIGTAGDNKTNYKSEDVIGPNGQLVQRASMYENGMKMKLEVGPRQAMEVNVSHIITRPQQDGSYQSQIFYTPNGSNRVAEIPYVAITQSNGSSRFARAGQR